MKRNFYTHTRAGLIQPNILRWSAALVVVTAMIAPAFGAALTPGNVVVTQGVNLYEFKLDGTLVQTMTPSNSPNGYNTWEGPTVSPDGVIHIYNQQFNSYLTSFNPATNTTSHNKIANMNVAGVTYYGNIASDAHYVYVPDITVSYDDPSGVVRFPLNDMTHPVRFATDTNPFAVSVGLNGLIYVLQNSYEVEVYDPVTFAHVKSYDLPQITGSTLHHLADIAVAANGDMYTINISGQVYHYDSNGNTIESTDYIPYAMTSIELMSDGTLILGATGNRFIVMNTADLNTYTSHFFEGVGTVFVAAVPLPEPGTLAALLILLPALAHRRRRP